MLLSINNINQRDPASPALWNTRFAKVVEVVNGNIDTENLKNGAVTAEKLAANTLEALYPIGSIYMNASNPANPGGLFGFGTWEAFGQGRVLVGKADSGTFATAGTTMGSETQALTVDQLPAHNHDGTTGWSGDHSHGFTRDVVATSGSGNHRTYTFGGSGQQLAWSVVGMSTAGGHNHGFVTNNRGGGQAHNNIQPSIVVYMWRRVA